MSGPHPPRQPWWIFVVVLVCAALMALGAIMALVNPAMLVGPNAAINDAVRVYAGYLVSRNLAIALLLVVTLFLGARRPLVTMLVLTALVQFADVALDCLEARWNLVPGVLVIAIALTFAASRVAGRRLLAPSFWQDGGQE